MDDMQRTVHPSLEPLKGQIGLVSAWYVKADVEPAQLAPPPSAPVLTLGEEMLIARVMPVMVFWEMSATAMGYSGHVCNKTQHIEEIVLKLPSF